MLFVREKSFYRSLLVVALPVAFQNLISFANNMVDSLMVSQLGSNAQAAVAQASQWIVFLMMVLKGINNGASLMISQYWGKKDERRIRQIFAIGLQTSLAIASVFALGGWFSPQAIMRIFTSKTELYGIGSEYLRLLAFSFLFYAATETLIAMLRSVEIVRVSLLVSVVSLIANTTGNYVFIFGHFGFPALGVRGAALATVLARLLELVSLLIYVRWKESRFRLRLRDFLSRDPLMGADYLRYGLPLAMADIAWGFVGVGKQILIGKLPVDAIAANNIAEIVLQLVMMFSWGMSAAAAIQIGKTIGEGDLERTRRYSTTIQVIFLGLGIIAAAITFWLRYPVVSLFGSSPETKQIAADFLVFGALTIWATAYAAACFLGINRGAGDVRFVLHVNLITGWLIVLPLTALAVFVFRWPPAVVFFCTRSDQILKVFIAYFRLRGTRWIHRVTRN